LTALVERMTFEPCVSSGNTICTLVVSGGPVTDKTNLTPEMQREYADDAMVRTLVPGLVLLIGGFWLAAKGFRQAGEHRAEPGQVRAE
jgi:hypothetical protein